MLNRAAAPRRNVLYDIPDGPEGVRVTLELMRQLTREWRKNPELRKLAENIISGVAEKDFVGEIRALFEFVRDQIRYTQDTNEVELIKAPDVLLESGQGDCDDKSLLLASLLESVGHPARFVVVGFQPDDFSHVYVETKIGADRWIPLDASEPVEMGWSPFDGEEPILARMNWRI